MPEPEKCGYCDKVLDADGDCPDTECKYWEEVVDDEVEDDDDEEVE